MYHRTTHRGWLNGVYWERDTVVCTLERWRLLCGDDPTFETWSTGFVGENLLVALSPPGFPLDIAESAWTTTTAPSRSRRF
jgi:hypothetical protein